MKSYRDSLIIRRRDWPACHNILTALGCRYSVYTGKGEMRLNLKPEVAELLTVVLTGRGPDPPKTLGNQEPGNPNSILKG